MLIYWNVLFQDTGMAGYREIDSGALRALLLQEDCLLVDVRTAEETARGIIEGARLIPLPLLPQQADELRGSRSLVFYCHSGLRSAQASAWMASHGRENVYNLRGGILAWGAAGYSLEPRT